MLRGCPTSEYDQQRTNADQTSSTDEPAEENGGAEGCATVDDMKRWFAIQPKRMQVQLLIETENSNISNLESDWAVSENFASPWQLSAMSCSCRRVSDGKSFGDE
jgi:hypothetical protein